jgi:hypothetical protein
MQAGELTYDGTTWRIDPAAIPDLVDRGVILPDPMNPGRFDLSPAHRIEEVEEHAAFERFQAGDEVRGESAAGGRRRLFAVSLLHRDGQGGRMG